VHEKCIPEGAQGLDVVENYANSASIEGNLDIQTFEMHTRQEDYESPALTTELLARILALNLATRRVIGSG
jgi:hypothetical protein